LRVLVTGASGLVGARVAYLLNQTGHELYSAYDAHKPTTGNPIHFDLTNLNQIPSVIKEISPNIIIHTAALTNVDLCEEKPEAAMLVNSEATGRIAGAASQIGAYMVYLSTDYVFDGITGSYGEEDRPNPINHYGQSKLLGEQLLRESGARHCIVRTSVVYGWGRERTPNFGTWVLSNLRSNQPVSALVDQFVSPTLNSSLAEMLLEVAQRRFDGVLHLAGNRRIDRFNFAVRIAQTFHLNPDLVTPVKKNMMEWKAKRPSDSSLNVEKARNLLNRKPLNLDEALERFRAEQKP
jgi:dTDP-4-dehydrorhamnose reductase